ncbi:DUF3077 domain-containing protein [Pseudomonas sp. RIT-To-2]|uniref:DUF3077 domain-containing protein n=1 Tax=Pseudomonas sp. RIT-To-2 TaxID=3462541 RepID=UPI0024134656
MTHETDLSATAPRETACTPFGYCDSHHLPIFNVRAGIPIDDALVQISLLLKCASESAQELGDYGVAQRGLLWSTLHSVDAAKALADALIDGGSGGG